VKTFYLPFDLSNILERVIYQIKPSVLVLIEMELWPNLILCAKRYSVPIVVINSRISQTSLRYYRKFYGLFKELFEGIDRFCVADSLYMERLLALGVERKRIFQVGNIRYDQEVGFDLLQSIYFYRKLFCIHEGLKVLVAGSTHHPEEEMLLRLYKRLSTEEKIRMIIAPRHLERLDELIKCAQRYGLSWLRRSQLNGMSAGVDVIFIDTIGELAKIYSIADLVFVGGTIAPRGGHNLLEPARLGKPIICGASLYNFRDVAEGLLKQGGMRIIHSEEELFEQIQLLLRDSKLLKSMGLSCKEFSSSLRGALGRSVEVIEDCIKKA
jgi:3-deoxy-D-manno-octulosonic-acid transferase